MTEQIATPANLTPAALAEANGLTAEQVLRLEALIKGCYTRMHWLALKYMKNEEEAQDVLQDSFIKAVRFFDGFRGDATFSTWMHRVVTNTALNRLAQTSRRAKVVTSVASFSADMDGDEQGQSVLESASHNDSPEAILEARQRQAFISRALSRLETEGPDLHRAFEAVVVQNREYADVSQELDLPLGTIRSRVHRARMYLRKELQTQDGADTYV